MFTKNKTVSDIQSGFATMINDLEVIETRELESYVAAQEEMERAHKESASANRFRNKLAELLG